MRNHSYRGKATGISYSEFVFLALVIQRIVRMGHIAGCGLSGCVIFSQLI